MDNPAPESSNEPLNQDSAAAAMAQLLDAPEGEEERQDEPSAQADEAPDEGDAPADGAEQPESDEDPLVTVKIDGKEVKVSLSELRNGYQRQADYTRKTMEAAETRRAAEAAQQQALAERQAYAANLQRMQAQIEGAIAQQQDIDWQQLLESDPQAYLRERHLWEQRQAALQQNIAAQQQMAVQFQQEQEARFKYHLAQQQEELLAKLPDWRDPAKATAGKQALRQYLQTQGYDEAAIQSVSDARAVLMAHKAMLYDQMVGKAQVAAKKVSNLPTKVERPGVGTPSQGLDRRASAYQRLSKSGRVEDAASVFASLI